MQQRRQEFRERHETKFLEAHARHARLQPSVEAVTQILHPEMAAQTTWVSETSFLRSMLLQPKPAPEDLGTVGQGLGDPSPFGAVHSCLIPPYTRREDYSFAPPAGEAVADAELNGQLAIKGACGSMLGIPQAAIGVAWVGHDFPVPAGIVLYEATIDYDFDFGGGATAIFGVAVVNLDVAILIDKRDGTADKSAQSVCTMIVPFAASDGFRRSGNVKVTVPFFRHSAGSAGTVRVMVGADGHCASWAQMGAALFDGDVLVREICINSTM